MPNARLSRRSSNIDTRMLIGVIADMETTIGFLLAGIGESTGTTQNTRNYMIVSDDTPINDLESFFTHLYNRKNIGVIFLASNVNHQLSPLIARLKKPIPIIIEIPTKSTLVKDKEIKQHTKKQRNYNSNL